LVSISGGFPMAKCFVCGNNYDKSFTVTREAEKLDFDCFECAIHALAPTCSHCGCKVIGHGVEQDAKTFCCEHCARQGAPAPAKVKVATQGNGKGKRGKDMV